jgi:hypothetical protein
MFMSSIHELNLRYIAVRLELNLRYIAIRLEV